MLESMFITTFVINKTEFQLPAIRKPTHEAGASTKRKKFRCPTTWENSGLLSQRPSQNPPAQAQGPYKDREGVIFFYPIIFLAFGTLGALSVYILAFHVFKPCPFIFLAFGISM